MSDAFQLWPLLSIDGRQRCSGDSREVLPEILQRFLRAIKKEVGGEKYNVRVTADVTLSLLRLFGCD